MTTSVRFGRNLTSLEFTSDPTDRATRISPLAATVGGSPTYLGGARWKVTANASGVLTLADPAGGAGPVGFNSQLTGWYVLREKTGLAYAVSTCVASTQAVTITGDPGIAANEYVQFRATATAGSPIAQGPGGPAFSLSRGYVLPLVVTAIATNTLTIASSSFITGIQQDSQYVGLDATFSAHVQSSTLDVQCLSGDFPVFTLSITGGADTSGLMAGDWCYNTTAGAPLSEFPPLEVVSIVSTNTLTCQPRFDGPSIVVGIITGLDVNFVRPNASASTVTASSHSGNTLTVASASGWSVSGGNGALELSYTPIRGEQPYYLDHPTYVAPTYPGIGVKFGTIDRSTVVGVANISPNSLFRSWTGGTPDGYSIDGGAATITEVTNPLYAPLGGESAFISGATLFRSPTIAWKPTTPNERFSFRVKLLISSGWSGTSALRTMAMRPGYVTADGSVYLFSWNDPILVMVPPDAQGVPSTWTKPAGGVFFDAVINGFDITVTKGLGGPAIGTVNESSPSTLAQATGFFVAITGNGSLFPDIYCAGVSITASDVAPDVITEYGGANTLWRDTNRALGLLAPPQVSYAVELVDLYRARYDTDASARLLLGASVCINDADLGVVNETQRIVEIQRNELVPGETRIVLANRMKRLTDLLFRQSAGTSALAGAQANNNPVATVGGNVGPTGSLTGDPGTIVPSLALTVSVDDTTGIPTASALTGGTSVKFYASTSGYGDASLTRAQTADSSAPFTVTGSAILPGQTYYVTGLAYNAGNAESQLAYASAQRNPYHASGSVSLALALSGSAAVGADGGTNPYKTVTYSHTDYGGSTDLSNFPLFVWTTDAALKTVANGGGVVNANHIRLASDSAGSTLLNWKVIHYDATTGLWVAVFKCASLSHTADTVVYLLSDDNGVTTFQGGTASNIWDANYKSVHLFGDGTTLDLNDETSNADNFTNTGPATAAAGPNGLGGVLCTAPGQYLDGANIQNIANPTFEYLCYPSGAGRIGGFVDTTSTSIADHTVSTDSSPVKSAFYVYDGSSKTITGATTVTTSAWHVICATADGTTMKVFLDGTQDASTAAGNAFAGYTHAGWRIGGSDGSGHINGAGTVKVAFAAMSNIARSSDWILARSKNFLSGSFFTVA